VWSQPFSFAGLTWERKGGCGGPGPNCWAPENAAPVAAEGVRMRLTRVAGRWYAAEIRTTAPVGYGSYSVRVVGRPDLFDASVVLGIFLYDDEGAEGGDPCPAELDLESSRFGDPQGPNGHAVVDVPGQCGPADLHEFSYALNGTFTTHQLDWIAGEAALRWMHGHRCSPETPDQLIAERIFRSPAVPVAGRMRLHINLWAFAGNGPADHQDVEVVIRDIVGTCDAVAATEPPPLDDGPSLAARPFPGGTDVRFTLPGDGRAQVTVVDVSGRTLARLVDADLPAGSHQVRWDHTAVPAGVYFARLTLAGVSVARRIVVVR
jgi:hypothetical protein